MNATLATSGRPGAVPRSVSLAAVMLLGTSTVSMAQIDSPVTAGSEFQVNAYTTGGQAAPAIDSGPTGDFVVVWEASYSAGSDTSYTSIQGQRFSAAGSPLGTQFQVNSYTTGTQSQPAVSVGAGGEFVVAWTSDGSPGNDDSSVSVQAQRFESTGVTAGTQFQVNSYTTSSQTSASVAAAPAGAFVVAWDSFDSTAGGIRAQRFGAGGLPIDGEIQVETHTTGDQMQPSLSVGPGGEFVIAWASEGSPETDSLLTSVQARRFQADGTPLGDQFQVNSYTINEQHYPDVAYGPGGEFIVVWESIGSCDSDRSAQSVRAQRFDSAGAPVAEPFQVNTYTTNGQGRPSVDVGASGEFVVAWLSYGSAGTDTSYFSIQAQQFTGDGAPRGSEIQVNSYTTFFQESPAVAAGPNDDFVVTWTSHLAPPPEDDFGIRAQRYVLGTVTTTTTTTTTTLAPGPQDKEQRKCIGALNKAGIKVATAQGKEITSCLKLARKGNDLITNACFTDDLRRKIAKAKLKVSASEMKLCENLPDFGYAGASSVNDAAVANELLLVDETIGYRFILNDHFEIAESIGVCRIAVQKAYEKVLAARLKLFVACKKTGLKNEIIVSNATLATKCFGALAADEKGKIGKAFSKLSKTVADCENDPFVGPGFLPGRCEGSPAVASCIDELVACRTCLMLEQMDGMAADCDAFDNGAADGSCPPPEICIP